MPRLPLVPEEPQEPVLARIFGEVRARGLAEVPALYRVLGNSPVVLDAWTALAWPLRFDATTPRALRELMIMRVAQLTDTPYMWHHHMTVGLAAGVRADQADALARWAESDAFTPGERAALRFTDETTRDLSVRDETFADLERLFSPAEIVELTVTVAFYCCVARVLRALAIGPEGEDAHAGG